MNSNLKTVIYNAARDGNLEELKRVLSRNYQQNISNLLAAKTNNTTPLVIACRNGHLDIVEYLVQVYRVNIEDVGSVIFEGETIEGAPPLWCAAAAGHLGIVKFLIEQGANVNCTTRTNSTPLRAACFDGHYEIVQYLVGKKAAQFLIENQVDVNRRSVKGNTALHDCAESGSLDILQLLLAHGAQFDVDSFGMTPILSAAVSGNANIVEFLITLPNVPEKEKIDALDLLGATYMDKKHDSIRALAMWHRSLKWLSELSGSYYKPCRSPLSDYEKHTEVSTVQELEEIASDPDRMHLQALLLRERILGPAHPDTSYYIRCRGAFYADSGDLHRCLALWMHALEQQQLLLEPMSLLTQSSFLSFAELFRLILLDQPSRLQSQHKLTFSDIFRVLQMGFQELHAGLEQLHRVDSFEKDASSFHHLCVILLHYVSFLLLLPQRWQPEEERQLCSLLYKLVHLDSRGRNGWSLLHMACVRDTTAVGKYTLSHFPSHDVVELLCQVGADLNCQDYDGNTPLHLAAMDPSFNSTDVVETLLCAGAHSDIVNLDRKVFLDYCKSPTDLVILHLIGFRSLKCLCASQIRLAHIPFQGFIPKHLEDFVMLH